MAFTASPNFYETSNTGKSIDFQCCDKGDKYNPANFHPFLDGVGGGKQGARHVKLGDLKTYIAEEVSDTPEVTNFFASQPFLPYAGMDKHTSHQLVCKLLDMKSLSLTKGAVMNSINSYCFAGKIKLAQGEDVEFDLGQEERILEGAEQQAFYDYLKSIDLYGFTWKTLTNSLSSNEQSTGEMWLELVMYEELGQRYYKINYIASPEVCHKIVKEGEPHVVGISNRWDYNYCKKNPPKELPLYPYYVVDEDGAMRSVLKYTNRAKKLRGRPEDFASFIDQYNEYKLREYLTKQINNGFLGQVLIEIEDAGMPHGLLDANGAKQAGYTSSLDRIEKSYTNRGDDPTSVLAMTRPKGAKEAFVKQFVPNTNEKFICKIQDKLRQSIITANDWSEALLLKDSASGFNSDMFKDIFNILSCTRVLEQQQKVSGFLNLAIKIGGEWLENGMEQYQIKFTSPVQKLMEQSVMEEQDEQITENG